jgi:ATP-binding cassette subfamily B (MDR/TAP) protein 1
MFQVLRERVDFWCGLYLMIGFTTLIGWLGQGVCFAYYSQSLTYEVRRQTLDIILRQDMASFHREGQSTAALTNILSNSANHLQGLSGVVFGILLVILTTLVAGLALALAVGWKLALVCACTIPVQLGCGFLRLKCLALFESHSLKVYEASGAYACEYSANIKTVASLTLEEKIKRDYHGILEEQRKKSVASISQSSLLYAASQSINFLCAALAFWYGGRLIITDHYTMFQFFVCYTAIITGAFSAGAIFSFAPDIGKAMTATIAIKNLFETPISINSSEQKSFSLPLVDGSIRLDDVSFRYPNRPQNLVLDSINLEVQPGQYIGLVGASGSGKSTIIALLERFYDPDAGRVIVGGNDINAWNVNSYRSHLALVGQIPTLFDGTIRDNVLLGIDDEDCSGEMVVQACKDANIYDFIASLQ